MKQPYSEAEAPAYDAEYKPDHILLFGATVVVVVGAYLLCSVVPWLQKKKQSPQQRPASHPEEVEMARSTSPECTQTSPRRAAPAHTMQSDLHHAVRPHTMQSDLYTAISNHLPDRPFRFRAPDTEADAPADAHVWASPEQQQSKQSQQSQHEQQQQQFQTPTPPRHRRQQQQQEQPASTWEPELLSKYAPDSPYISSVEALQRSPLYRSHISQVRGRRLNYETAESHKLRVYRALRDVDPPGFQRLFSRQDIQEYDEVTPSRLLSVFECLVSSALTLALLVLPWLLPRLATHRSAAAAAWCVLHVLAVRHGCTSPAAWLLRIHTTQGEFNMLPSFKKLLTAAALEAGLTVCTAGMGLLVSLGYRLLTQQRQSFADRLLRLVPLQEVVRPMHFSALPPAGAAGAGELPGDE